MAAGLKQLNGLTWAMRVVRGGDVYEDKSRSLISPIKLAICLIPVVLKPEIY